MGYHHRMADLLRFDPEPLKAVESLFARADAGDRSAAHLADRLDERFDALEERPIPTSARARYLRPPGLWMIVIPMSNDQDDWAILWDQPDQQQTVVVRYVGPASFA